MSDRPAREHVAWTAVAAAASLAAAATWSADFRRRRAGIDPSGQEAVPIAREALMVDVDRARLLTHRLGLLLHGGSSPSAPEAVRRVGALLILGRLRPVVHRLHQRLLSLYPEVGSDTIEAARITESLAEDALQGRTDPDACRRAVLELLESLES